MACCIRSVGFSVVLSVSCCVDVSFSGSGGLGMGLVHCRKVLRCGGFCGRQRACSSFVRSIWGLEVTCRPSTAPKNKHVISNLFRSNAPIARTAYWQVQVFSCILTKDSRRSVFACSFPCVFRKISLALQNVVFGAKFPDFPLKIRFC